MISGLATWCTDASTQLPHPACPWERAGRTAAAATRAFLPSGEVKWDPLPHIERGLPQAWLDEANNSPKLEGLHLANATWRRAARRRDVRGMRTPVVPIWSESLAQQRLTPAALS